MKHIGVVLMGGLSSRFGSPKAWYQWKGQSLAQHALSLLLPFCDHLVLVARCDQEVGDWGQNQVIHDEEGVDASPLRGIATVQKAFPHDKLLVIPCDAPWIQPQLLHHLCEYTNDSGAAFEWEGRLMPFPALWGPSSNTYVRLSLMSGNKSPRQCLNQIPIRILGEQIWRKFDFSGQSFQSANTPQELI